MKTLLRTLRLKRSSKSNSSSESHIRLNSIIKPKYNSRTETSTQRQCPLFTKLPTEIRLLIWEYVIGSPDIHVQYYRKHPKNWAAIIYTCRLIHSETHPLLYTQPTLHFPSTDAFSIFRFSTSTTRTMFPLLQHIVLTTNFKNECEGIDMEFVEWGGEKWSGAITLLRSLEKVQSVRLVIDDRTEFLGRAEMRMLEGIEVGRGNGRGQEEGKIEIVMLHGCKEEVREMEREGGVGWGIVEMEE
ncbi:hypothetical protein K491DRAFT_405123 [Lophiostoma macrostomum CBS 122681]|uniref:DUF7730 domain-containing protein n=1 Tax=Lophiostoma macrostomum CBS 122681 TaxID=1314788 RepID=A0A6A6T9E8_9PLEO|nr:hypothetical protein K491DRAFT_405123 [Lophiostoma macrostomum CBS 122681]